MSSTESPGNPLSGDDGTGQTGLVIPERPRWRTRVKWRSVLDVAATASMIVTSLLLARNLVIGMSPGRGAPESASPPVVAMPSRPLLLKGTPTKGAESAKAVMIIYSDFECPFCGRFARETLPLLEKRYVTPGELRIAFRHRPLENHRFALGAASAGLCADAQGRFWEFHDGLFASAGPLDGPHVRSTASSAGLDLTMFDRCVSGPVALEGVRQDVAEAKELNILTTPTFLFGTVEDGDGVKISSVLNGAKPIDAFEQVIDKLIRDGR